MADAGTAGPGSSPLARSVPTDVYPIPPAHQWAENPPPRKKINYLTATTMATVTMDATTMVAGRGGRAGGRWGECERKQWRGANGEENGFQMELDGTHGIGDKNFHH